MLCPNVVAWNVMFKGYTVAGLHAETLALFVHMRSRDVRPNGFTFTFVVKSCAQNLRWREGKRVHCFAIKTGFEANGVVGTTLIEFYSSAGAIEPARKVFDGMPARNVVAWTAIVRAYLLIGKLETARAIFDRAVDWDVILWNTMISGYVEQGDMAAAWELFSGMPEHDRDVMAWNTILLGYANNGDLVSCERVFDEMPERNLFSWNALITGYVCHGCFPDVWSVFKRMFRSSDVMPNDATLIAILSACAKLGVISPGRLIHVYAETNGFNGNLYIANGLIDMYSKCGCIEDALLIFCRMEIKDLITWNVMIGGLATHGHGMDSLELFEQMLEEGEKPDGITFVGILSACVHMGMVDNGFIYFRLMTEDYGITPWIEHCGCMVDLLGRAGLLSEAVDFMRKMPMKPDSVIWSVLLGACQVHNDIALAKLVMNNIIKLKPEDVTNYVVLSNIYGAAGRWKDVIGLKRIVRNKRGVKLAGCSFVELDSHVFEFSSSDARHSQTWEIYQVLDGLKALINSVRFENELQEVCVS